MTFELLLTSWQSAVNNKSNNNSNNNNNIDDDNHSHKDDDDDDDKIIKNLSIKFQKSPEFWLVFTIPVRHIGNITYVIFINITWEVEISTKIARFHDP